MNIKELNFVNEKEDESYNSSLKNSSFHQSFIRQSVIDTHPEFSVLNHSRTTPLFFKANYSLISISLLIVSKAALRFNNTGIVSSPLLLLIFFCHFILLKQLFQQSDFAYKLFAVFVMQVFYSDDH